jgi:hypothetical protein
MPSRQAQIDPNIFKSIPDELEAVIAEIMALEQVGQSSCERYGAGRARIGRASYISLACAARGSMAAIVTSAATDGLQRAPLFILSSHHGDRIRNNCARPRRQATEKKGGLTFSGGDPSVTPSDLPRLI